MEHYRVIIRPQTAFATALKGDTLFGQLCWAVCHLHGESKLTEWLRDYRLGHPFLIVSDALPAGYLPRPKVPATLLGFDASQAAGRKQAKALTWLPEAQRQQPLNAWHRHLVTATLAGLEVVIEERYHNTLNRLTSSTGTGQFAPYSSAQWHYRNGAALAIYVCIDPLRIDIDQFTKLLTYCGQTGFGRDASTGLGKFELCELAPQSAPKASHHWLTLAPSAPMDAGLDAQHCYYSLFTRFGKHGDRAVLTGKPFKTPVLLADSAALLRFKEPRTVDFIGSGLGGDGRLSKALPATVHQGYSPVVAVNREGN